MMSKLAKNPHLSEYLTNANFIADIGNCVHNPKGMLSKYKDDPEFTNGLN